MRIRPRHLSTGLLALVFSLTLAAPLGAQEDAANITELIRLEIVSGQEDAFEEGVETHHGNLRTEGGEHPVYIWQIVTGKHSGDYQVGLVGRTWADFDESTPEAVQQSLQENVLPHVADHTVTFWQHHPDLSYDSGEEGDGPPALTTVTFYELKGGEGDAFTHAVRQVKKAAEEADYQESGWGVHQLEYGGGPVWAIVSNQASWADLAEPETTLGDLLEEQMSEYEMDALIEQFDKAVKHAHSEILNYREELSYIPEEGDM